MIAAKIKICIAPLTHRNQLSCYVLIGMKQIWPFEQSF